MPQRFTVPQFIDTEDRIMGPLTVRQFLILLVDALLIFIAFKLFDFTLFVLVGLVLFAIGGIIAFMRINGQPFHFFVLNVLQTLKKPGIRIWDKTYTTAELKEIISKPPPPPAPARVIKHRVATSRLSELSLLLNTGGVYNPDEQ